MPPSQNRCLDDLIREVLDRKLSELSLGGGGVTFPPVTSERLHAENLTVASGGQVTVLSYTNGSTNLYMDVLVVEGNIDACWEMHIETVRKSRFRTDQMSGTQVIPMGPGSILAPNETVEIKVEHFFGSNCDFSATIFGHRR